MSTPTIAVRNPYEPGAWFEEFKLDHGFPYFGPAVRTAFVGGAARMRAALLEWDSIPPKDAIAELRKGEPSIFWPLFKDDPRIWVDCPNCGRVVIGPDGFCDGCTYEFDK